MRLQRNSWLEDPNRRGKIDWMRLFGALLAVAYCVPVVAVIGGWPNFFGGYILGPADFAITTGIISVSEVTEMRSRYGRSFHCHIEYEYDVDGYRRHSSRVAFSLEGFASREEAEAYLMRYPIGAMVDVHYYRRDPGFSVLEPETRDQALPMFWVILLATPPIVIGLTVVAWFQSRKRLRRGLGQRLGAS